MSQRDHIIGAALLSLTLGVAATTLLMWADAVTTAVGLAIGFVPVFVVSHWAAELLGTAWDRRGAQQDAEKDRASDSGI